ncbi:TrlF family AAA-like ATPase [Rhizobium rhizogenes]|uniref:PHP-like protein n=1 Tax=Rhizobium rhizogenes TaxID=359 RepID=A0AA92H720_RHIRH|nr:AAA family ATPase [Rhizobium rhizogenes]PVE49900.1 PHP-like protein [Rhizobium rhizogenes]PVE62019.1 PHP-like protein [Agrobacterium tumefaciens]PVE69783.1 PHP-like protein [Sphingomonas sp. TPD3009]
MDYTSVGIEEAILALPTGAKFHRADLHIHSFGASHDVRDETMTPANIVATAQREGLSLIAVTDHNEISNVEPLLRAAQGTNILVVPGVELSTPQGHLLCYFPDLESLQRFYARLTLADRGTANSRCQQSIIECLNIAGEMHGFGILAHVDIQSGFEIEVPGASPHKFDIIAHKALLGIELKHAASLISYAFGDPDADRARMGKTRIERLKLGSRQYLARVLNSDAHSLLNLGRNAELQKRVTRYKMDTLSFGALRLALDDADARVRIEDLIPPSIPHVVGISLDGGFLTGQSIQFSQNLNCIIGGRGTGKSTTFEGVRCLVGLDPDCKVLDSEVWPDILHLFWRDKAGVLHRLQRHKEGEMINLDGDDRPVTFEIDCFGQGDAAKISIQAQTNPLALQSYLDRFIDIRGALHTETEIRDKLLELQSKIEEAEQKVELIPQYERLLTTTRQQLEALKKPEVTELITLQRTLSTERAVQAGVAAVITEAKKQVSSGNFSDFAERIREVSTVNSLTVGREEFQTILTAASSYETTVGAAEGQIRSSVEALEGVVKTQIAAWKAKEAAAQTRIDEKRRELEALNVAFDMTYISKLANDEAAHEQAIKNLTAWKPHLEALRKQRVQALRERWVQREKVATLRDAFGRKASAILSESLSDLFVSLRYSRNAFSPEAESIIINAMGWRTNQQVRANYLVANLTIPRLLDAISKKDVAALTAIKTPEGVSVFKSDEARSILDTLAEKMNRQALERVAVHDLPKLQVTRHTPSATTGVHHITRDFSKLSLGQQQSVLLALMLSSDSDRPLIIDQPEDNLDGEFIYATLVPVLRRAKERRQIIIVTHNPNVAVLGDAEQLVVLKALNDRGTITVRGSIDHVETRDAACGILEGAKEAFIRRSSMYGFGSYILPE